MLQVPSVGTAVAGVVTAGGSAEVSNLARMLAICAAPGAPSDEETRA